MSRMNGYYTPTNPDRVNPQFIGIGQKYSSHKKNRMLSDQQYKNISSNLSFTVKLNQQLSRNLLEKQKQLARLQQVRNRHRDDIKNKLQQKQKRQYQLSKLKQKSKQQRLSITQGIKFGRNQLQSQKNAINRINKQFLFDKKMEYKAQFQATKNQNILKFRSVKMNKKLGNQKINKYFRHKNLSACHNYMSKIQSQDDKFSQNQEKIRCMQNQMEILEKQINKKQNKLKNILQQINMYAVQCQNQRKANFLATVSVFRASTTTSSRLKPIDVLKINFSRDLEKQIKQTI